MRFAKWQALGNDYLILERDQLPWELSPERVRALCHRNFGPGGDGVLLIERLDGDAVASLRIFNPDGSEASLSGNGAREAAMYIHSLGWSGSPTFTITTPAGPVVPTVLDTTTCAMTLGRASTVGPDWPDGPEDGRGEVAVAGRPRECQFVDVGNPQLAIEIPADELEELDLHSVGPEIENDARFPNRTNVSFWAATAGGIRARIFERGVGETLSSGTGASGAAVAAHLRGHGDQLTVALDGGELQVAIDNDRRLTLTGWAVPVYEGQLSAAFEEELR